MPTNAGTSIEIFQGMPNIWFSPLPKTQILPGADVDYGDQWPSGFELFPYTANGLLWTFVMPRQDINVDEVGIFRTVASGANTINASVQTISPSMPMMQKISSFAKDISAARAEVRTLALTAGASAVGTVIVRLNGTDHTVTLTGTAPLTADAVATQLRAATYTGWTTSGTGANVIFTSTTTGAKNVGTYSINNGTAAGVAGGFTRTTVGRRAFDRFTQDPSSDGAFLLGCDGIAKAGTLKPTATRIRMIAYYAQQTDNPQGRMATQGTDSLFRPTLTARCLPQGLDKAVQLPASTGFDQDEVDEDGRFDWFVFDAA